MVGLTDSAIESNVTLMRVNNFKVVTAGCDITDFSILSHVNICAAEMTFDCNFPFHRHMPSNQPIRGKHSYRNTMIGCWTCSHAYKKMACPQFTFRWEIKCKFMKWKSNCILVFDKRSFWMCLDLNPSCSYHFRNKAISLPLDWGFKSWAESTARF